MAVMDINDRLEDAYFAINHSRAELFDAMCEARKEDSPIHDYADKLTTLYRDLAHMQREIAFAHPQQLCEY